MEKKSYREVFPKQRTFLAVIHVVSDEQAYQNTNIALDNGADGVFLINHAISAATLLEHYQRVREWCRPEAWIGLNLLRMHRADALRAVAHVQGVSGLWADSEVDGNFSRSEGSVREFHKLLKDSPFKGLYFGGVEFKGRQQSSDPAKMARLVAPYMDVITTSGEETGSPPSLDKIMLMREAIPDGILANASGLGPDDVEPYLPYLDCILAATKISKGFYELDPAKVNAFAKSM
jgi:hypothetical protein